jgi:hypothetical protein
MEAHCEGGQGPPRAVIPRKKKKYFLSNKDPAEHTFSPIWKSLMKLEHKHQDTYGKAFFYTIYRIFHVTII